MKDGQFLLTNYGVKVELDTTPFGTSRTWVALDQGFDNLDEELNDQVQEYFFLGDKGFGSDYVTGVHPKYKLTGTRVVGDPAQDYIFDNKFNLMNGRTTHLRISIPRADGSVIRFTNTVSLTEMKSFGGSANEGSSVEVNLSFMGAPFVDTVVLTTSLVITTVAGTNPGETVVTVTPTYPDAGCKYVYAIDADEQPTVTIGDVLTTWADFTNNSTYEIPDGYYISVAQINQATYTVVGVGYGTVTSNTGVDLTVTTAAGTTSGTTIVTVAESLDDGYEYVYYIADSAQDVSVNDNLSTWTAFTSGTTEITAETGKVVTVGLVNSTTKLATGSGSATVISNDFTTLTVTSVAGSTTGDTLITIAETAGDGQSFVYQVAESAVDVSAGDDLSSGWTAITSGTEITATSGEYITVALMNDTTLVACGAGNAVIVSAT